MLHLPRPRAALLTLLVIPVAMGLAAGGGNAAAAPPPRAPSDATQALTRRDAAAVAVAYLRARANAVIGSSQAGALAAYCPPGAALARREATLAAGARSLARDLGHTTTAVSCRVKVGSVRVSAASGAATVTAHVVSLITWTDRQDRANTEGEGLDHVVTLVARGGRWLVTHDAYSSDLTPRLLEAGGASRAAVATAAKSLPQIVAGPATQAPAAPPLADMPPAGAPLVGGPRLGYAAQFTYDRDAAKAYADNYALSYNPTFVNFSADCANFGSQVMLAGGYPVFGDTYSSGWWYDKGGTSSPSNDTYSHAWIAVANQQGAWNVKYTDFVASISDCARGDFVYYDWTGDGTWDHVAELAGTNSAGQKVIDAHTTDHYHVFWKLGTSATRYRFARTRATVVI
jgi:Putative amidase domain